MFDIMSGSNRFWNFLRLNLFPKILSALTKRRFLQRRIFPLISQTGINYRDSFLSLKSNIGKLQAGDRMAFFVFSNGRHIYSYIHKPCFKLLFFGDHQFDRSKEVKGNKLLMELMSFADIPKTVFGDAINFYILLRPDNHISYIGPEIEKCKSMMQMINVA